MKVRTIGLLALAIVFVGVSGASAALDIDRLLVYWTCDEGAGDTLADSSGNGFDATILGGAHSWEDGQFGKAVQMANAHAEVQGDIIGTTGETGEISLVCWFIMRDHAAYDGLISIEAPEGDCCEYRFLVSPAFGPYWNAGRHADKNLNGVFTFELDTWYHMAMVADGEFTKIYVDGEFVGEQPEAFDLPEFKDVTLYLGTGESPGVHPVEDTTFDEVMIWDKALSEGEVAELIAGDILAVQPLDKLASTWAGIKSPRN